MQDSKVMSKKRRAVLFVLLGVIIAGLIVGIVVLAIKNNTASVAVDEEWSKNVGCFENGTAYEIAVCISDIYDTDKIDNSDTGNKELVIGLYNKVIDAALSEEDYVKARELMVSKSSFFVLDDDCETAMRLLNDEKIGRLDDGSKSVFYSYAMSMSVDCNDEEGMNRWNDLLENYDNGDGDGIGF